MERIKYTTPYYDETLTGAYTMKSGETIIFETPDCWGNALTEAITKGELYAKGLEMNPCGGPVQVEGAEPGDTLKIDVIDIEVGEAGHLAIYKPEFGVLANIWMATRQSKFQWWMELQSCMENMKFRFGLCWACLR